MNNQNPLIPQGSLLEQKDKGRARVRIAVLFVLAVHGIVMLTLLMQGCRRDEGVPPSGEPTNAPPTFVEPSNAPPVVEPAPAAPPSSPPAAVVEPTAPPVPLPAAPSAQEYTVAKGDSFTSIGKKFGVTAKEIADANPGVDSTKLKIGSKLHIPAVTKPAAPAAAGAAPGEPSNGSQLYTVKSGDTLSRIATQHGTTLKALRAANSLKTDRITVGQKLKIPGKAAAAASATPVEPAPAGATSTPPVPAPVPQ